ncbi:MAG: hypothetical protein NT047_14925 [Deltaproteobacteria bacterium]|nr:hypothetical protein [Deltaproteobacteria bacterium]
MDRPFSISRDSIKRVDRHRFPVCSYTIKTGSVKPKYGEEKSFEIFTNGVIATKPGGNEHGGEYGGEP